ncbi:hypothetical protein M9194_18555 [Vibrio sp. S4M6]|uniref:hypothetical protein n=1 Tax=Vibrio sinus TaxID=2946865 RepID=UPI00202A881F|nr:hypothetical protein [Vibrio sinus]MCL9783431.1 hypothetical protein [Vibrio sinus]
MIKRLKSAAMARITLLLVGWVFAICFLQNTSLISMCTFKQSALNENLKLKDDGTDLQEQCDLTEKLLCSAKVNLDNTMVPMFWVFVIIVAWLVQVRPEASSFTEPIVPKSRVHVTLCIFRE